MPGLHRQGPLRGPGAPGVSTVRHTPTGSTAGRIDGGHRACQGRAGKGRRHRRQALFLAGHGVEDVEGRTHTLLTCVDGLVFDRLVSGGEVRPEELEGLVAAALR